MPVNFRFPSIRKVRRSIIVGWICVAIGALGVVPSLIPLPPQLLWLEDVGGGVVVLAVLSVFIVGIYSIATIGRPRE